MTRDLVSLSVPDLSSFAKALRRELSAAERPAGHLALMNMLARSAGFQNLQHLQASKSAAEKSDEEPALDRAKIDAMLRYFDREGRLTRWPAKTSLQHLAVRILWARIPARQHMTERGFSEMLNQWHLFGDAPILRRTMVELALITRSADCRDYCRVESAPSLEAREIIGLLAKRISAVA